MGDIRANLPLPRANPWNHGLEIAAAARRRDCPDSEGRVCVCGLLADISRIKPLKPGNTKELEKKLKIILAFRARYKLFTELIKLVWNFSLKISLIN